MNDFPTYYDAYQMMSPPDNITDQLAGGRLIPRSVIEQNLGDLVNIFRNTVERNAGFLISGVMVNSSRVAYPDNSVNPAWRDALVDVVIGAYVFHSHSLPGLGRALINLNPGCSTILTGIAMSLATSSLPILLCHR